MPAIQLKVNRAPRLDLPKFTRTEMRDIGTAVQDAETTRIKAAQKADGSAAAPLKVHRTRKGAPYGYAIFKQRKVGRNRRDWTLTGAMLGALRTTVSDPTRAVIKFSSDQVKKAMIREARDEMFDLSTRGSKAGAAAAQQYWDKAIRRANRGTP